MKRIFIFLFIFSISIFNIFAQDFYIDGDNGSDLNDGSISSPFASIDKGYSEALTGGDEADTLIVYATTTNYTLSADIYYDTNISMLGIISEDSGLPYVVTSYRIENNVDNTADSSFIKNIHFYNNSAFGILRYMNSVTNLEISNCFFEGGGYTVVLQYGAKINCKIHNNYFANSIGQPFRYYSGAGFNGNIIENNVFYNNKSAIFLETIGGPAYDTFCNNLFINNTEAFVFLTINGQYIGINNYWNNNSGTQTVNTFYELNPYLANSDTLGATPLFDVYYSEQTPDTILYGGEDNNAIGLNYDGILSFSYADTSLNNEQKQNTILNDWFNYQFDTTYNLSSNEKYNILSEYYVLISVCNSLMIESSDSYSISQLFALGSTTDTPIITNKKSGSVVYKGQDVFVFYDGYKGETEVQTIICFDTYTSTPIAVFNTPAININDSLTIEITDYMDTVGIYYYRFVPIGITQE